jgi:YVTN family beta-propeller protein
MRQCAIPLFFLTLLQLSCTYEKAEPSAPQVSQGTKGYPKEVGAILLGKCAVSGCHNDVSSSAAGGLSLSSWENMFRGSNTGPVVIPYSTRQSSLLFYVNTYSDLGVALQPTMPYGKPPLSREEVLMLKDWINRGAPDDKGFVKFSDNPERKKAYITNQGCDEVYVIDTESGRVMRVIEAGTVPGSIESPHVVKVSPDGEYWFLVFLNGTVVQKFRASDDSPAGFFTIGSGNWNTIAVTEDVKKAFAADWSGNGKIAYINLETGGVLFYPSLKNPHGIAVNKAGTHLYVTSQTGNYIYKIDITDPESPAEEMIVLETGQPVKYTSVLDPHEILFSPDGSRYFVTCQRSNEVRVMKSSNDSLLAVIPTGSYPQEMSISLSSDYLFVSCTEDSAGAPPFTKGSVAVINYKTLAPVKKIYGFYQPHGIAVDDLYGRVYVSSRNISSQGPAPHHTTECGGKNGFLQQIDLKTLGLISNYRIELSVDPYFIDIRK